ncbi:carbohydrate-binding protein [uncultured Aquimarina sp.]|uniref:carbohydrate-binding protein n=1 Tax=uncultured Aquimarina sp. TaxID=575652 RepID=UPI0026072942|nr:carbohydrate-binding protein [uncultured Aquimarina sp.]
MRLYLSKLFLFLFLFQIASSQEWKWENVNLQGMGFVTGIIAHPLYEDVVYARTDVGGVFRWKNSSSEWVPLMDGKNIGYSVESISLDRQNKDILYAKMGNREVGQLYKSTDLGNSWLPIPLNVYVEGNGEWRHSGERLSAHGDLLYYASRRDGLWKSTNQGDSWFQISKDKIPFGEEGGQVFSLIHPIENNIVYVGVQGFGIYKTDDSGVSWSLLRGGPDIKLKPIHGALSNDGVLYVTYADGPSANREGKVYKYLGDGDLIDVTPSIKESQGFAGISVNPNDRNEVFTFQWNFGNNKGMHRSIDGGNSWDSLTFASDNIEEPGYYPSWSAYTYAGQILIDPTNPNRAWITTGFAVYKTNNRKASNPEWKVENQNLEEFVCISIVSPPQQPKEVILGVADMAGMSLTKFNEVPNNKFYPNEFGIISDISFCETDPKHIAYVGSSQYGSVTAYTGLSNDGGNTWENFASIPTNMQNGNIAFSSSNPNIMVWVPMSQSNLGLPSDQWQVDARYTTDRGRTWKKSNGLPQRIESLRQYWFCSKSLIADPINGNTFYLYDRKNIYKSSDNGANWNVVGNVPVDWYQVVLKAKPGTSELYFVNKSGGFLYKSLDQGKSWNPISNVTDCINFAFGKNKINDDSDVLYIVASIDGKKDIYKSENNDENWENTNAYKTLPMDKVSTMDASKDQYGKIYFGTGGRGAFVGVLSESTEIDQTTFNNNGENWIIKDLSSIEAENFDDGGEGISYSDIDIENIGKQYRETSVDIEANSNGFHIGWVNDSEWLEYSVDVEKDGSYDFIVNLASKFENPGKLRIKLDDTVLGVIDVENTGDWKKFESFKLENIELVKGTNKVLRFEMIDGYFNIDRITFSLIKSMTNGFVITALGRSGTEKFDVYVDDIQISSENQVTQNFEEYMFNFEPKSKVQIHFINDGIAPNGINNDLRIDHIRVGDKIYQAENQSINTGGWNHETENCGGAELEWLNCTGYIEFSLENQNRSSLSDNLDFEFKLYPNPVSDILHLSLENNHQKLQYINDVSIINLEGRVLYKKEKLNTIDADIQFNTSNLENGVYFLRISYCNGKSIVHRFLMNDNSY